MAEPTPAPGRSPDDLLARATALRQDAVRHLTLLAGDASMCAIGRSGRSFPAAKYHEGRQAAAGQVRRALRADASVGPAVLDPLREEWTRTLDSAGRMEPVFSREQRSMHRPQPTQLSESM